LSCRVLLYQGKKMTERDATLHRLMTALDAFTFALPGEKDKARTELIAAFEARDDQTLSPDELRTKVKWLAALRRAENSPEPAPTPATRPIGRRTKTVLQPPDSFGTDPKL
jgi:hypothetical protein